MSSRRGFLKHSVLSASALVSANAWQKLSVAEDPQSSSPSEILGFAIVGCGGRGGSHIDAINSRKDAEIVAIVDADSKIGNDRADQIEKNARRRPQVFTDLRQALELKSIDCVSTATPNHWHSLVSIWSMQAGKDVYCEKPVSHNVWEGRQMVNASRKLNRICQCGTQSRSSPSLMEAVKYVRSGELGAIKYAVATCYKRRPSIGKLTEPLKIPENIDYDLWCGPAEKVDLYRPKLHYDWHWDFNTGNGDLGNQGIHQMDIARWFLGENELSPQVLSVGGRLGYVDAGNTPNTQFIYHGFAKAPLIFEVRGLPKSKAESDQLDNYRGSGVGVIIQCENGHVLVPSYGEAIAMDPSGVIVNKWTGGADHHANFIKAVRSRKREDLNADILEGHLSSALCHTGNISHKLGKPATVADVQAALAGKDQLLDSFDRMCAHLKANEVSLDGPIMTLGQSLTMDTAKETFVGNAAADLMLTRIYRRGFEVPNMA